jgi:hypothetical protein
MERKVVFIMGPGHCGSTLLDLILGSHSQGFSLGEMHRLREIIDHNTEEPRKICGICIGRCRFWDDRASYGVLRRFFSRRTPYRKIIAKLMQWTNNPYKYIFMWSQKNLVIDSSKQPGWFRARMKPHYTWSGMTPYLVYLCRDGRAVVNSYFRKYPERGIANIVTNWKNQIMKMNDFYQAFPADHRIKVRYEELATDPDKTLGVLCRFLGVDFESAMLRYWEHDHHTLMGNLGTKTLIYRYRSQQESSTSAFLEELNRGDRYFASGYYGGEGLQIRLDVRWREELSREQVDAFEAMGGDVNAEWAWEGDGSPKASP